MEQQIKELRIKIDGLAQLTKELKPVKLEKVTFENNIGKIKNKNNFEYIDEGLLIILEKSNSKEIEKAVDSLYLAKAWLGKILAELGVESPYKSGYKTVEDIQPTADVTSKEINNIEIGNTWRIEGLEREPNYIEKVDWLRTEIEKLTTIIKDFGKPTEWFIPSREFNIARTNSYNYLSEARFWLGFELQRVREESINKAFDDCKMVTPTMSPNKTNE